jgi:hypothetical protein
MQFICDCPPNCILSDEHCFIIFDHTIPLPKLHKRPIVKVHTYHNSFRTLYCFPKVQIDIQNPHWRNIKLYCITETDKEIIKTFTYSLFLMPLAVPMATVGVVAGDKKERLMILAEVENDTNYYDITSLVKSDIMKQLQSVYTSITHNELQT